MEDIYFAEVNSKIIFIETDENISELTSVKKSKFSFSFFSVKEN